MKPQLMLAAVLIPLALPAQAAGIVCREGYQVIRGGEEISTPYCRDNYLAQLARRSGMKVSDAEVRNSPLKKREICRFIGSNIEAQPACADVDDRHPRGF